MKVMSLNVWCGNIYEPLMEFLKHHKDSIDVFCFQEVFDFSDPNEPKKIGSTLEHPTYNIQQQIADLLTDHVTYFAPRFGRYGQSMFIRKSIDMLALNAYVIRDGHTRVLPLPGHPTIAQYVDMTQDGTSYRVINVHGWWAGPGAGKQDNEDRIVQSIELLQVVSSSPYPVILVGDLNLNPDTESLAMLEREGLINWIKKTEATSTRSSLYTKDLRFADYIFTSPELEVQSFEVLQDEVSDHLPLVIDVSKKSA